VFKMVQTCERKWLHLRGEWMTWKKVVAKETEGNQIKFGEKLLSMTWAVMDLQKISLWIETVGIEVEEKILFK